MDKLLFRVNEYEGPLDLILHLISKHQLDIADIEITALLRQYMEAIRGMEEQSLEIASEFLEMASRLVYIKTVSLLPRYEEEADAARAELVGQLLEYQACKEAAARLGERNQSFAVFVHPTEEIPVDKTYTRTHPAAIMAKHYWDAVGKGRRKLPPRQDTFAPLVTAVMVSVTSRVIYILRQLYKSATMNLSGLFAGAGSKSELVADFLAVLQLVGAGRVTLTDDCETIVFIPRDKGGRGTASPK